MKLKICSRNFIPLWKNIMCPSIIQIGSLMKPHNYYFTSFVNKNNTDNHTYDVSKRETLNTNEPKSGDPFKNFEQTEIYQNLKSKISEILEQEDIVLFIKGTPENPMCGFSANVINILNKMEVKDYVYIDVLKNPNIREAIKIYSNWPYIPHLYIKNKFIGGHDIICDLYNSGELVNIIKS